MAGGRPDKYSDLEIAQIAVDLEQYINERDDPTIVGFTSSYLKYPVNKQYISDRKEFSDLVKRAVDKQEAYLLTNSGEAPVMRIFRLKQPQHGYRDKVEQDITSGGNALSPVLVRFITGSQDIIEGETSEPKQLND